MGAVRSCSVLFFCDNGVTVWLSKDWTLAFSLLWNLLCRKLFTYCQTCSVVINAFRKPRAANCTASASSL